MSSCCQKLLHNTEETFTSSCSLCAGKTNAPAPMILLFFFPNPHHLDFGGLVVHCCCFCMAWLHAFLLPSQHVEAYGATKQLSYQNHIETSHMLVLTSQGNRNRLENKTLNSHQKKKEKKENKNKNNFKKILKRTSTFSGFQY